MKPQDEAQDIFTAGFKAGVEAATGIKPAWELWGRSGFDAWSIYEQEDHHWNTRISHSTPGDAEVVRLKAELRAVKALADYHFRNAQSLAARLATPSGRAQAWLPIETAPKDGTHILGYASGKYAIVYWSGTSWELSEVGAYAENGEWTPTHWQPLPAAPPAQDQTKGDEA